MAVLRAFESGRWHYIFLGVILLYLHHTLKNVLQLLLLVLNDALRLRIFNLYIQAV